MCDLCCACCLAWCCAVASNLTTVNSCGVQVKDDSCGQDCRDDTTADYKAMQDALTATGRPMVLSIEGWEDVRVISAGGHGQTKRVGHDIGKNWLLTAAFEMDPDSDCADWYVGNNRNRPWYSIVTEIDLSSGLWPYAHNGSNGSGGGFWNDMEYVRRIMA